MSVNKYSKRKNNSSNDYDILGIILIIISAFLLLCSIIPVIFGIISEEIDILYAIAENARGMVFLENDAITVGEDFKGILYGNVHLFTDLGRKHNSSQLIYSAYNSLFTLGPL